MALSQRTGAKSRNIAVYILSSLTSNWKQIHETLIFVNMALSQQLEQNQEKLKADVLSTWLCRNVHELHLDTRYLLAQY